MLIDIFIFLLNYWHTDSVIVLSLVRVRWRLLTMICTALVSRQQFLCGTRCARSLQQLLRVAAEVVVVPKRDGFVEDMMASAWRWRSCSERRFNLRWAILGGCLPVVMLSSSLFFVVNALSDHNGWLDFPLVAVYMMLLSSEHCLRLFRFQMRLPLFILLD